MNYTGLLTQVCLDMDNAPIKDEDENVHVSLVMGKSCVVPRKITSIPRAIQRITHPETPRREAMPNAPLYGDQYRKLFSLWKAWTKGRLNAMFWKVLREIIHDLLFRF